MINFYLSMLNTDFLDIYEKFTTVQPSKDENAPLTIEDIYKIT